MKRIPTYKIQGIVAGGVILFLNYFTVGLFVDHPDLLERLRHFLFWIDLGAFFSFLFLFRKQEGLLNILKTSPTYNLIFLLCYLGALLVANRIFPGKFKVLRLALYLLAVLQMGRAFVLTIVRNPYQLQPWVRNLAAFEYVLFFLLLIAEAAFLFPAKSRGAFPDALSQINWNLRYRGPLNSQGMWEEELPSQYPGEKKQVFYLGDSFGAGWGIRDPQKRVPEQVEAAFPGLEVWNLSIPGGDTRSQTEVLQRQSWRPDLLVHVWVPNDIERLARSEGLSRPETGLRSRMDFLPEFIRYYSALFNFAQAEFIYPAENSSYLSYLDRCFKNEAVLNRHVAEIRELVAESGKAQSLHLLFPIMGKEENSFSHTGALAGELEKEGLEVIDLWPLIEPLPLEARIVNHTDQHPSPKVQEIAADTLIKWIRKHPELH